MNIFNKLKVYQTLEKSPKTELSTQLVRIAYFLVILLAVGVTGFGVYALATPLIISVMIYAMLNPLTDFVEGLGIPRFLAAVFALLTFFSGIGLAGYLLIPLITAEITSLAAHSETYKDKFFQLIADLTLFAKENAPAFLDASSLDPKELTGYLFTFIGDLLPSTGNLVQGLGILQEYVVAILINSIIVLIASSYLLMNGYSIYIKMMELVPNRYFEMVIMMISKVKSKISSYLRAILLQWLIMLAILLPGYILAGLTYGPFFAVYGATVNIIPYLGPALGIVPPVVMALIDSSNPGLMFYVLVTFGLAQTVDNLYNQPVLLASSVNLNPLLSIIAIGTFQTLFGAVGMVIAVPFMGVLLVTISVMKKNLKAFGVI